ncbi:MAG: acyl-CoA dehydrogenase family protein [Hyphomonadaceae bacterium]
MEFQAPIRDLLSALAAAGFAEVQAQRAFSDLDDDTLRAVLIAAGEYAAARLAPLNRDGDIEGARYENGRVTAPKGFAEAYRAFAADGWNSLAAPADAGGQGLPKTLELAVFECANAANAAFSLCPMLTLGAIEALDAFADARQRTLYLPRLVSGEWTGTMNLTEPQAGSDLAALITRAEPDGAGGWRLSGQKIFITWGDHDMADNIVHLVLARTPGAPAGVRGISLFLAPKRLVGADGALGAANTLRPGSIEHKLGIHGSPTCVMLYEGAHAELVGEENRGLAQMFVMMNAARLHVGVQGVGLAERAYQQAYAYARERRQGRSAWNRAYPAPIFDHPDVRRMLMLMKAKTAAARRICLLAGVAADLSRHADDEDRRDAARARWELLTPIAKAWSTDVGVEVASLGVQVHGGMGFVEETGAAQYYRDARIAPIYEGANGVQAIDLVGRKIAGEPAAANALLAEIAAEAEGALIPALAALRDATEWMRAHQGPDSLAGASAYLTLWGDVLGGWLLARSRAPLQRFYAEQVLAHAPALAAAATAGAAALDLPPAAFES